MRNPVSRLLSLSVYAVAAVALAQPVAHPAAKTASSARAVRAYEEAVHGGPLAMTAYMARFPKGADLHVHLSGAIYAETFIRDAAEDGMCVDTVALKFMKPPCTEQAIPATRLSGTVTSQDQDLYDRLIDSFSLRSFVPAAGVSGHDQFFSTFGRFGGLDKRHTGEWVDEVAERAAAQNQQYLELMQTPPSGHATTIAHELGWNADFAQMRQTLLDHGLRDEVKADREDVREAEVQRRKIENCESAQATPACKVEIRYIYQVLRGFAPEQVFAQTLLGFETIKASQESGESGGFVGINFVQPEDGLISMRDYTLQMKMMDYLHSVYPQVHITLHAGELVPGLVPPEGLRFHIRQAVDLGHAERIGHGVDVMYEDDAAALLKELAEKHVMIEVNLTSNEGILGVKGEWHPFMNYRAAHVPVALSTDDEGVSRIDITHEYVRAALDYHLKYDEVKDMVRTGMEHNFLPGKSLWAAPDKFTTPVAACRGQISGNEKPSGTCAEWLKSSEKASAQWELERRFAQFEAQF